MSTIEQAIEIAAKAHAGVKDKQGEPYILHPLRVMMGVQGEAAQIVAVLHDVVEDTGVSVDDIRNQGFSANVIEALGLVTHRKDQPYSDYVVGCKGNDIARRVKLSDLRDNMNLNRLLLRPEKLDRDSARIHRYVLSYRFLTDELEEQQYRGLMIEFDNPM